MKLLLNLTFLMVFVLSCTENNIMQDTVIQTPNITGTWKPLRYEYKGKNYPVNTCQAKGQILINSDFSGVYERYSHSPSTDNCNLLDSFSGKWNYNLMSNTLVLSYAEAGTIKTLSKNIETFSDNLLKVSDNTEDLDNIVGNDDAILVFIKQ